MNGIAVLLALLPVILIFLLLVVAKKAADISGALGWLAAVVIAWLYFKTPLAVALKASASGMVASFPISLMVATSIFQVTVMLECGAIARVVALMKTVSPQDKVVQVLLINIGFGTLIAAMGATPVSILPPIMLALGYSTFISIALPALGYDALCTYALLGVPVLVFANFVGRPVNDIGHLFARYMPFISTCIAFGMLWIIGGWRMIWRGFIPTVLAGVSAGLIAIGMNAVGLVPLTGIAAGLGVVAVMLAYLKLRGRPLIDRSLLKEEDLAVEKKMGLLAAASPWLLLIVFSVLINLKALPFEKLFNVTWAMPLAVIPGAPEKIRLLSQAYFWILFATFLAMPFLKVNRQQLGVSLKKWWRRAPRPVFAAAIFFALAYVLNHSGKGSDWQLLASGQNMIAVVATGAASLFGKFYPIIAPFIGLLGGFVSGSEASSIAMLTKLHLATAEKIGAYGILIAAASGIGGGLASVISPAKLQNAAASIDRIGEETKVIPVTFVIAVAITLVCAVLTLWWSY
ncbi:MAG: L-lactate permease [Candidatus Aminicenantes bacterium]|nr:L-lactate permease [Candidatus Aminicenantes bacterium]